MQRFRTILITLLLVLFCIVFLQNTKAVETKILFMSVVMPRAILLLIAMLIGFAVGLIFPFILKHAKKKNKEQKSQSE